MCGRFSRFTGQDVIINRFGVNENRTQLNRSYNIAPTDAVPIIRRENPIVMEAMRWGYIPFYTKDLKGSQTPINARDDSLMKSMYKKSLQNRRCIIPVDGFYEWKEMGGTKQPFFIRLKEKEVFGFGGIYSKWKEHENDPTIYSFAIITTNPNEQMSDIHDRMPLILKKEQEQDWLEIDLKLNQIKSIIQPYDGELEIFPVSKYVNSPKNNSPECMEAISLDSIGVDKNQKELDDFF